ncbi:MAG TPA: hypothetical protein VGC76_01840, partial [Pyrinomonadaceae bacterium]
MSELNKTERDTFISKQFNNKKPILIPDIDKTQVLSKEGIQARMDALDALGNYGDLLLKLANSDAPERVNAQVTNLKDALTHLSGTIGSLSDDDPNGGPNNGFNKTFKDAVGPVTQIIGTVLDIIVQQKIKKELEEAILKGEQPINELISVIGIDLRAAYSRKATAISAKRLAAVNEYNSQQILYQQELGKSGGPDPAVISDLTEKMRALAENIRESEDKWEQLGNANPQEALEAMAAAHTALIKFAKSKKKISDFGSLVEAMDFFAERAQQFG